MRGNRFASEQLQEGIPFQITKEAVVECPGAVNDAADLRPLFGAVLGQPRSE